MALNLSVIKSPAGVSLAQAERVFSEQGGSIGRGDSNDWVLADPDRFLSSKHCALSFEGGQFYLTDMSTNGTFINGAPEPIGKGGKIPLNDGDTIEIGDYQFRAEASAGLGAGAGNDPFAAGNQMPLDDPFGSDSQAPLEDPFGQSDPFANSDPFGSPTPPPVNNDSPFGDSAPLEPFGSDPFAQPNNDVSLNPDPVNSDPLAALDNAHRPDQNFGHNAGPGSAPIDDPLAQSPTPPPSDDLFGQSPKNSDQLFGSNATHNDGAGALGQAVDWPSSNNESVIPEDWDDDDLMGGPAVAPEPEAAPQVNPSIPQEEIPRSIPLTNPPQMPPKENASPVDGSLLAERKPERVDVFGGGAQQSSRPLTPEPQPAVRDVQSSSKESTPPPRAVPESKPAVSGKSGAGQVNRAALAQSVGNALLEGMGLGEKTLSSDEVESIHAEVGALMPVIITGMMQVLRSRASIKNEFRMNVTTIQPIENNPLKFSADANEAIANMFLRNSSAYMGPKQAFQEGFDGIGEHQVAIIAGIRAAFKSMMDRFNPEILERQFDKQNKGVVLPGMQKSKYWNSYSDYYNGFVDNMENTFQYLFGDEFVQAYEDQLRRLAVERKKRHKV